MELRISILSFVCAVIAVAILCAVNTPNTSFAKQDKVTAARAVTVLPVGVSLCGNNAGPSSINDAIYADRWANTAPEEGLARTQRIGDLPGIVKLEPEHDLSLAEVSRGHCSATRIAENWFISAAHCVATGYDRIILKAGHKSLSSDEIKIVPVETAVCHADFEENANQFQNDLALLHIANEHLPALDGVPVVSWGTPRQTFNKKNYSSARTGGWGLMTYGGELNDFLQSVELDIFSIDKTTIRVSSRAGRGPCVGDSGGPLFVNDAGTPVLMGVLSTISSNRAGDMCQGNYLSNYMNLNSFQSWARSTMAVCDANKALCGAS